MGVSVEGMGERGGRMYKEKQIKPTKKKEQNRVWCGGGKANMKTES